MAEDKERIAKKIAAAGLCSRRDAERWILDGRVEVNGVKLKTPALVVGNEDVIVVDGVPLKKQDIRSAHSASWKPPKTSGL